MIYNIDQTLLVREWLQNGQVVAFPTETVYGIGASIKYEKAIRRIYELKNRPLKNPLIVHVGSVEDALKCINTCPTYVKKIMEHFWPGALTLVLPKHNSIPNIVTANSSYVAIRMSNHPIMKILLKGGSPIVAPSANKSGFPSATTAQHVYDDFGDQIPIIDGGKTKYGIESTIILCKEKNITLLRYGAILLHDIQQVVPNISIIDKVPKSIASPGNHFKHYTPKARVLWYSKNTSIEKALYLFHSTLPRAIAKVPYVKYYENDIQYFVSDLYNQFRYADSHKLTHVYIESLKNVLDTNPWKAVLMDRLNRVIIND